MTFKSLPAKPLLLHSDPPGLGLHAFSGLVPKQGEVGGSSKMVGCIDGQKRIVFFFL